QERDIVHVVYAGEKFNEDSLVPAPHVDEFEEIDGMRVLTLESITRMKLTAFRSKDIGHLTLLMKDRLIHVSMVDKLPDVLKGRFLAAWQEYLDTREPWDYDNWEEQI